MAEDLLIEAATDSGYAIDEPQGRWRRWRAPGARQSRQLCPGRSSQIHIYRREWNERSYATD